MLVPAVVFLLLSACTTARIVPVDDQKRFGPTAVGDLVEIDLSTGEHVAGRVAAVEPDALVVDGHRVTIGEMRSLYVEKPDMARTASIGTGAFAGVVLGPALVLASIVVFGGMAIAAW